MWTKDMTPNPFTLQGQTILVFGAASGIGACTAELCAQLGASVALVDIADLSPVAAKLAASGHSARAFACDVTDRKAVEHTVAQAGAFDAMIVCSGICPFEDWQDPDWDAVYDRTNAVNVKGTVNCVRAALAPLMKQGRGRIVLVGSIAGRAGGLLSGPHYVASKGAVGSLVRWFARLGASRNVLVNGVAPGPVDTQMIAGQRVNLDSIPLRRIATPKELAGPIAFLCSPAASYICGAMLDVNGGVYMN